MARFTYGHFVQYNVLMMAVVYFVMFGFLYSSFTKFRQVCGTAF